MLGDCTSDPSLEPTILSMEVDDEDALRVNIDYESEPSQISRHLSRNLRQRHAFLPSPVPTPSSLQRGMDCGPRLTR